MAVHVVAPGECLTSIAAHYGFSDYKKVYEDPSNQALRKKRPDPNTLQPGDEVNIPEKKQKWVSISPGQHKKLVLKSKFVRKLRLVMLNDADKPLANLPYKLVIGEVTIEGKTDGDGVLEQELPAKVTEATLNISGAVHHLSLGGLNPMKDTSDASVSGVQARLLNLGYAPGEVDGRLTTQTTEAIIGFQRDHGMEMTGEIDDKLIDALAKAHGC